MLQQSIPLAEFQPASRVGGVFFDIDDTFTTDGQMSATAFSALSRWRTSGRLAVAVTGRPAGWCDHIARMWPVSAVVGENGAFWFYFDQRSRRLRRHYMQSAQTRETQKKQFHEIAGVICKKVPGVQVSADQDYRVSDLAIDFAEDVPPLGLSAADQVAQIMRDFGMTAKISSIHVNGWFGDFNKLTSSLEMAETIFGIGSDALRQEYVYIGDSPNDSPMFGFFNQSIGVANVRRYVGRMEHWPAFICQNESSDGFAEAINYILEIQEKSE